MRDYNDYIPFYTIVVLAIYVQTNIPRIDRYFMISFNFTKRSKYNKNTILVFYQCLNLLYSIPSTVELISR